MANENVMKCILRILYGNVLKFRHHITRIRFITDKLNLTFTRKIHVVLLLASYYIRIVPYRWIVW